MSDMLKLVIFQLILGGIKNDSKLVNHKHDKKEIR